VEFFTPRNRKKRAEGWWAPAPSPFPKKLYIYIRQKNICFSVDMEGFPNLWPLDHGNKMMIDHDRIGTFGFQVFRDAPTFQSFNFSRSSKDALAHTKDASIGVCLSKLSGADAQSKPVRPEDYYSALFEFGPWQNQGMMAIKNQT
jgi:hypothetical protein